MTGGEAAALLVPKIRLVLDYPTPNQLGQERRYTSPGLTLHRNLLGSIATRSHISDYDICYSERSLAYAMVLGTQFYTASKKLAVRILG